METMKINYQKQLNEQVAKVKEERINHDQKILEVIGKGTGKVNQYKKQLEDKSLQMKNMQKKYRAVILALNDKLTQKK